MSARPIDSQIFQNPFPNGQMANVLDEEAHLKIEQYAQQLFARFAQAADEHRAAQTLYGFLENPKEFLIVEDHFMIGLNTYLFPFLSECACVNSENFNRFKNTRRADLENRMLEDMELDCPLSENLTLRYLSLGSGGLLQDFINVGKLLRKGYKQIDVCLVDPIFYKEKDQEHIKDLQTQFNFLTAAANELGVKLNITYLDSIKKCQGQFHVIQMIDFDDFKSAFKDMLQAHELLEQNGKFYLSFDVNDLVFDKLQCVSYKIHRKLDEDDKIASKLRQEVQKMNRKEINAAFLSDQQNIKQWTQILKEMTQVEGLEKISLTLMQPQRMFCERALGINDQFSKESLEKFLSLLTGRQISITLIQSFEEFKNINQKYDIITQLFAAYETRKIESNVIWLKENHLESCMFFALEAFKNQNEEYKLVWEGVWKWNESQGIDFIEEPNEKNKAEIIQLMKKKSSFCLML